MRYYIADNHFFHKNLLDKMDKRGFNSVEEMHDYMIQQWNSRVNKNDEVVVLGDFSMGTWEETQPIIDKLKGKIMFIEGNHDRFLSKIPSDYHRFIWVKQYAELSDDNRKVICCHYPIACYNGQYRKTSEGEPKRYMMHGHVHNTLDQDFLDLYVKQVKRLDIPCELLNCFCMYSDYIPLTLSEWIDFHRARVL